MTKHCANPAEKERVEQVDGNFEAALRVLKGQSTREALVRLDTILQSGAKLDAGTGVREVYQLVGSSLRGKPCEKEPPRLEYDECHEANCRIIDAVRKAHPEIEIFTFGIERSETKDLFYLVRAPRDARLPDQGDPYVACISGGELLGREEILERYESLVRRHSRLHGRLIADERLFNREDDFVIREVDARKWEVHAQALGFGELMAKSEAEVCYDSMLAHSNLPRVIYDRKRGENLRRGVPFRTDDPLQDVAAQLFTRGRYALMLPPVKWSETHTEMGFCKVNNPEVPAEYSALRKEIQAKLPDVEVVDRPWHLLFHRETERHCRIMGLIVPEERLEAVANLLRERRQQKTR